MAVFSRLLSFLIRLAQLVLALVVAGIIGYYLHHWGGDNSSWPTGRWIYTEVIAAISILLGLILLLPFTATIIMWHLDLFVALAWFSVFGILVDAIGDVSCNSVWDLSGLSHSTDCDRWKTAEAFSFITAILWLASAVVGLSFIRRVGDRAASHRRYWYGRYDV